MPRAQKYEDTIDRMREEMRGNYIMRLQSGMCTVDPGLILVDMLTAFEKIGDFCYNVTTGRCGDQVGMECVLFKNPGRNEFFESEIAYQEI